MIRTGQLIERRRTLVGKLDKTITIKNTPGELPTIIYKPLTEKSWMIVDAKLDGPIANQGVTIVDLQ